MLDFSPLKKASKQLEKSLAYCNSQLAQDNPELQLILRSASIQAFEFTFELSIKMLQRQLSIVDIAANIDQLSYRDLLRVAAEKGFIADPVAWFGYREKRNITSHSYDYAKAESIYKVLPDFLNQVNFLISSLEKHNDVN